VPPIQLNSPCYLIQGTHYCDEPYLNYESYQTYESLTPMIASLTPMIASLTPMTLMIR
jgi:hypothetical protein